MRFVIYGAGAIGGLAGGRLYVAGSEVVLIARGAHGEAIAARGLTVESPGRRETLAIPVCAAPGMLEFRPGDVVVLAVKSQDTLAALLALREAAGADVPVVCAQNGVSNEPEALRYFEEVYGALVVCPAVHLEPGMVAGYGAPVAGIIDVGRYPSGTGARAQEICAALSAAGFRSAARERIMPFKYAKLLTNLANAIELVCGPRPADGGPSDVAGEELVARARGEGEAVLRAAGIEFVAESELWGGEPIATGEIDGRPRAGGSTWQSAVRGAASVESDHLNGEVVLLGRLHGVPTPVNALLQRLALQTVRERRGAGWLTAAEVLARLPA